MKFQSNEERKALIEKHTPKSKKGKNAALAFFFGGSLCLIGELLRRLYLSLTQNEELSLTLVSLSLIFLAASLTAFGFFDRIARHAGAGTLVPITGFSNAVVSEAMDSSSEGYVLGVGAKIFTVAGPVILFGIFSGTLYGIIYFIVKEIMKMV